MFYGLKTRIEVGIRFWPSSETDVFFETSPRSGLSIVDAIRAIVISGT